MIATFAWAMVKVSAMNGVGAKLARVRRARRKLVPGVSGKSVAKLLRVLSRESAKWNAPIVALAAQQNEDPFLTLI